MKTGGETISEGYKNPLVALYKITPAPLKKHSQH